MEDGPEFEWNRRKNESNFKKHGVTFWEAREIWNDPLHYRVKVADDPENRWLVVGRVARSRYLSAIITYRGGREKRVRIISARASSKAEVGRYHG